MRYPKAAVAFRIAGMIIMGICFAYNQRVDAIAIGILTLIATVRCD